MTKVTSGQWHGGNTNWDSYTQTKSWTDFIKIWNLCLWVKIMVEKRTFKSLKISHTFLKDNLQT